MDVLYFDFSKAFDTASHHKLLIKMTSMGVDHKLINIVADFLSQRFMYVRIGNDLSEKKEVMSGVPQGSVLGPLLFVIYVNDIPEMVNSVAKLFADNLKIVVNPSNKDCILRDLKLLECWQNTWSLTFNTSNHYSCSNTHQKHDFMRTDLPDESFEKGLGVTFDATLKFHYHIDQTILNAKNCLLPWLRVLLSRKATVVSIVYVALVWPHLEYCTQVWAPQPVHGHWSKILRIKAVQRLATRSNAGLYGLS